MRVAYLAAGAGGMLCGSCLRDNRLAAAWLAAGRDVVLMPLYTPLRTDETDVSTGRVFYGGLNVYLEQKHPWFRRLPRRLTRWLDAPWLLRRAMKLAGDTRPSDLGELTVSVLHGAHGAQRRELDALLEGLQKIRPDLVKLPNLMFVGVAESIHESLGVPVLCTLSGEDVFLDQLVEPYRRQAFDLIRRGAEHVDAFIAVTNYYAAHTAEQFALPRERVHVVPMGVSVDEFAEAVRPPESLFTIGYLARICAEKGLHQLCDAFARLRAAGRDCRLRVAGYLGPADRPYFENAVERLRADGCGDHVEYVGEVDRAGKRAFLQSLDVLCVPTVYKEAKGFYVLEAMACGVPVVQPRHGSFPELIEATGGGVLYDPADDAALATAIAALMDDPAWRARLGQAGREGVRASFTTAIMAEQAWAICERIADEE